MGCKKQRVAETCRVGWVLAALSLAPPFGWWGVFQNSDCSASSETPSIVTTGKSDSMGLVT